MKAAQIQNYSKNIAVNMVDIPIPEIAKNEVLVKVKVAAVNPLELLTISGKVKLIQDYAMPLTLGNELTGIVEKIGEDVTTFKPGDQVYTRLPLTKIGAFAEYVAVDAAALAFLPKNLDFITGAGVPLTGLTAYQGITEVLNAQKGQTIFIPGGSGSFGQMVVPIAKHFGLRVIVSGNSAAKERLLAAGVDQYLDYKQENYWEVLADIDYVIDTLGPKEFERELAIIKPGGKLLSLVSGPNKEFAMLHNFPKWKQWLFGLAGAKFDKKAQKKNISYHFVFVRADGQQLQEITNIVDNKQIVPTIHPTHFTIEQLNDALDLVSHGHPNGKVVIQF